MVGTGVKGGYVKTQTVLMPLVGVGTVAATTLAGVVPGVAVVPVDEAPSGVDVASTVGVADGTLEPCSEYFGFGKATDLVAFDVQVVEGETPDPAPTFEDGDVGIVLVLGNEDDDELRCLPSEVTEEEWDEFWDDFYEGLPDDEPPTFRPPWPGPGHYYYPALNVPPVDSVDEPLPRFVRWREPIEDFGDVTEVGFEVSGVEAPFTLVSPTGYQALNQVVTDLASGFFACLDDDAALSLSPNLLARVNDLADPDAVSALIDAGDTACSGPVVDGLGLDAADLVSGAAIDEDLLDAVAAMLAIYGYTPGQIDDLLEEFEADDPEDFEEFFPFLALPIAGLATPVADFEAAAANTAIIELATPAPPAPEPVVPRFTG
jgi:hypothetical protein